MYKTILVPVDGSTTSQRGLEEAIRLAKLCGGSLRLVHVVNELILEAGYLPLTNYGEITEGLREAGKKTLSAAEARVRAAGIPCESELIETLGGQAAHSILDQCRRCGADIIVMGTHGRRGIRRLALGSDAEIVLRHAPVPVLLVRDAPEKA